METKLQTSFIPKKPITSDYSDDGSKVSLLTLLSIIAFIVVVAMVAGIIFWKDSLTKKIDADKQQLLKTKEAYEPNTIESLIRLDDRITVSNQLLSSHLAVSPVFKLLELETLRNIRFKTMRFSYGDNNKVSLTMSGVARNFETVAKQSDIFGTLKFLQQPVISDLNLTQDGSVSFNFTATIDKTLVSYQTSRNINVGDQGTTTANTN